MGPFKIYYTKSILHALIYIIFEFHGADQTATEISSPPTFSATLGPMVGQRVGRSKIYFVKSILHALICNLFNFNGARSNRTRDILSGPPFGPLLVLWWDDQKYTLSNRFYLSQYAFCSTFMEL